MVQLSFSQNRYPQKWVVENDTLVVISADQLATTNVIFVDRNNYRDNIVPLYESLVEKQDSVIQELQLQVNSWEQMDKVNKSIIEGMELQQKQNKQAKNRQLWVVGGVCVCVGFGIGALVFGLCK